MELATCTRRSLHEACVLLFNEIQRRKQKYGMVTIYVDAGQRAASVFELFK